MAGIQRIYCRLLSYSYSNCLLTRARFSRFVWGVKQYFKLEHGLTHKQPLHLFSGEVGFSFLEDVLKVCRVGSEVGATSGAMLRCDCVTLYDHINSSPAFTGLVVTRKAS